VTQGPDFLARATTSAFCFGLTRQQITLAALKQTLKNDSAVV
jgi:hypothetical protein